MVGTRAGRHEVTLDDDAFAKGARCVPSLDHECIFYADRSDALQALNYLEGKGIPVLPNEAGGKIRLNEAFCVAAFVLHVDTSTLSESQQISWQRLKHELGDVQPNTGQAVQACYHKRHAPQQLYPGVEAFLRSL